MEKVGYCLKIKTRSVKSSYKIRSNDLSVFNNRKKKQQQRTIFKVENFI